MDRGDVINLFGYLKACGLRPPATASSADGQEAMINAFLGQYSKLNGQQVDGLREKLSRLKYWPRFYDVDEALEEIRREKAAEAQREANKPITQASAPQLRRNAKIVAWTMWKMGQGRPIMPYMPEHNEILAYGAKLGLNREETMANYQLLKIVLNDMIFAKTAGTKDIGYKVYVSPNREVCFSVTSAVGFNPNKLVQTPYDPVASNPKLANLL